MPDVKVRRSAIDWFAIGWIHLVLRLYCCLFIGTAKVKLVNPRIFCEDLERSLSKKARSIIAFRHCYGNEPQIMSWFIIFKLRAIAKKLGINFSEKPLSRMIYGYEVVRWGGPLARFVLPRVGGLPVYHAKFDSTAMRAISEALLTGPNPLSLAPEGQVSYDADHVPRLEPGAFRIAFQTALQLEKEGIPVETLPFSIHYRYDKKKGERDMEKLLRRVETMCGLAPAQDSDFHTRVLACRESLMALNEAHYGIQPPAGDDGSLNSSSPLAGDESSPCELRRGGDWAARCEAIREAALQRTAAILACKDRGGDRFARMYYLRQVCWDRIYLPGQFDLDNLTEVERSKRDLEAGEAWYAQRHLEMTDFLSYFGGAAPANNAPLHQRIEYVHNLYDFASRSSGGAFDQRAVIAPKTVYFVAEPAISISDKLALYRKDKKEATNQVLKELEAAYLKCINEMMSVEE
jgi:hypothetical protein